jgi:hypothetical protein
MITSKRNSAWIGILVMAIFFASCSSVSDLPQDEVYYSRNVKTTGEYDWDNFQKSAQSFDNGNATKNSSGDVYAGSGDIATTVSAIDANNDDQFIDDYYGSNYEERLNRFGSNSTNNGFDYYDGYNSNYGCNCGQSSLSFGFGVGSYGYGSGWSMGYGYGWPHSYYGGSSYWAGYNAGYNAGYYNGYWGYPYYGYPYYGYPYYGYGGYYGYGPGWGWGGGMSTTTVNTYDYTVGTLVCSVFDTNEKKLIWEGSGSGEINENPQDRENSIPKAVSKIMAQYPIPANKK